jgi:hypothetical protein
MVSPGSLIRAVPVEYPAGRAWAYALLTVGVIFLVGAGVPFSVLAVGFALAGENDWPVFLVAAAGFTLGGPAACALLIALWGLCTHATLRLSGGAPHPIGRTYQALCYSAGANVTTAAPCIGVYPFIFVGLCWWLVSAVLMVGAAHRVHGGRAALATLIFPGLLLGLLFAGVVGMTFLSVGQARSFALVAEQEAECAQMLAELSRRAQGQGTWPRHALALATDGGLAETDFITGDWQRFDHDVSVGDTTLRELGLMPPGRRAEAIEAIVAGQPGGLVAHRLGDYVFTYHGVPTTPGPFDGAFWLFVQSPDPDLDMAAFGGDSLVVGMLDGSVLTIPNEEFAAELASQNDWRAENGLPPLPDPSTVTHAQPAVE